MKNRKKCINLRLTKKEIFNAKSHCPAQQSDKKLGTIWVSVFQLTTAK